MDFAFDHLVWFWRRPEQAVLFLKEKGIRAVNGGRHESWGTYNALAYFGLSYIEFLGIENLSLAETHQENRLVRQIAGTLPRENGEGPAKIAVRTDHIEELAEKLKDEGFIVYGPIPGERVRGDGTVIRWSLVFPELPGSGCPLPFFIQWEKTDEERLKEFESQGLVGTHSAGHLKLESVGIAVHNLDETMKIWAKLFPVGQCGEYFDSTINARCRRVALPGTSLLFCSPEGEGPAGKALEEKGESPFLADMTGANQPRLFEMMNGLWRFPPIGTYD